MGMFDDDERTLFRPPPARSGGGGGGGAPVHQAQPTVAQGPQAPQEEETSIVESLSYAWRAAGRRKGRTVALGLLGIVATTVAAYLAPRE